MKKQLNDQKNLTCGLLPIPEKVLDVWSQFRTRGDITRLTDFTGYSRPVIYQALNDGKASPDLILKISKYFSKKPMKSLVEVEEQALKILNHQP
jgi:hypothetical protein